MKNLFLVLLIIPVFSFSQKLDSITDTKTEYLPVVVEIAMPKEKIYEKMKSWINRYYKNPKIVVKADDPNSYLRIEGINDYYFYQGGKVTNNIKYILEIEIQDNKYRLRFSNVSDDRLSVREFLPSAMYNKKGEFKSFKKVTQSIKIGILDSLNEIHFDIYNYFTVENKW